MSSPLESKPFCRVRLAGPGDLPAIVSVIDAAYSIETFIEGKRTDGENMADLMKNGVFLVAEDASGLLLASVYTRVDGRRGYLGMLSVQPSAQGTGLGRALVEAAESYCRSQGCTHMDLSVLSLRSELFPFYRKLGYVESGSKEFRPSRPLRVKVPCHCVVMSKRL